MNLLFATHPDFLSLTLNYAKPTTPSVSLASGTVSIPETGFLIFRTPAGTRNKVVISAGIHGNETAPIELLNQIISDIVSGQLEPKVDCLFIFGNPEAMNAGERFIDTNLNRLFASSGEEKIDTEYLRARIIMDQTRQFLENASHSVHYDLHTAIRDSFFEKFAIYPYLPARTCSPTHINLMGHSEIQAILLQNKPSTTFSGWTANNFGAESFTVELGKVAPFGQNDLSRLNGIDDTIRKLILGQSRSDLPERLPIQFQVVDEVINTGKGFTLCIEEDTANFTELPSGFEVWKDHETSYIVGEESLYIVFPNSNVGPGQRAGLLVKPMAGITLA
ncbi:succinylglutamate desuccinylase [Hahella sp. CCB-MM4]|uniref:succinylglutamate desuccinylase n=1 Tax=Hahella sp. (strain CCB-MM4) TaxID=1926491 RepID=UPI000B9AD75C|nr:succinylglutamate desuccinylase [Hahella sp. CCB-MM4]OZG72904.1 succinylglutamate desuccinylase [Hahella sp. CCB-MM4]